MRMFRFSSWISDSRGCEEAVDAFSDVMAEAKSAALLPARDVLVSKRKREDDGNSPHNLPQQHIPNPKRCKADDGTVTTEIQINSRGSEATRRARDIIEAQIGLEILLKHDELRRINQEMAKCQVALEQLRRCHLIPYPGSEGLSSHISNGTGPALANGNVQPRWAPAFGVTEGPYSRHYAKWLIPDTSFDGLQPEWQGSYVSTRAGKTIPEGRSTRNSYSDGGLLSSKARGQRGSAAQKLHALPSGYAPSKDTQGPSILKRADGQLVKLVCLDCHRENFGSTQGFINHCRIAHRREFKSHEEAATQSGQPVDVDEAGAVAGEDKTTGVTAPAASGLVHPLVRNAPSETSTYSALLSRIAASMDLYTAGNLKGVTSVPVSAKTSHASPRVLPATPPQANKRFVPSTITPHLSEMLSGRGFETNLSHLVTELKIPVEDDEDLSDSDAENVLPTPPPTRPFGLDGTNDASSSAMRMLGPARSGAIFDRPQSSKGLQSFVARKPGISPRLQYSTPVIDTMAANRRNVASSPDSDSEGTLMHAMHASGSSFSAIDHSPNTLASNTAPSLVSDDEYDDGDVPDESEIESLAGTDDHGSDQEAEIVDVEAVERERKKSGDEQPHVIGRKERHVGFVREVEDVPGVRKGKLKGC